MQPIIDHFSTHSTILEVVYGCIDPSLNGKYD